MKLADYPLTRLHGIIHDDFTGFVFETREDAVSYRDPDRPNIGNDHLDQTDDGYWIWWVDLI